MKKFGALLLGIFLILFALDQLVGLGGLRVAVPIVGLIAGILILVGR